jgi:predicted phage baseplate assembly protein
MSGEVWWERAADGREPGRIVPGPGPSGVQPELVEAAAESVRAEIGARVPSYTPDWSNPDRSDAGVALVRVFGSQTQPVLQRLNRLPEKLLVEHLNIAGVRPLPASPARALLEFTVTPPTGDSVLVPAGFQTGAPPATVAVPAGSESSPLGPGGAGSAGGQVVFETQRDLYATKATLGAVVVAESGRLQNIGGVASGRGRPFPAFGARPEAGNALWIGLAGDASPYPTLSLGVVVAPTSGAPAPAASGASADLAAPLLRWDVLDGGQLVGVQVAADGTDGLRRTGVVELRTPRTWRPGRPPGPRPLPTLRWLRVMAAHGAFATPPTIAALRLNMVAAVAVRTVRDEVLQPVLSGPVDGRTRMRLSQVPIVPGSVVLAVDDDAEGDVFGAVAAPPTQWREVESLADHGPDDRVFTVDHAVGELTFGDGVHGARIPLGFRNVVAQRYRVGGGAAGAVRPDTVTSLITSVTFVSGVTNPFPAEGGADAEAPEDTMRRGAAQLGAGGRAVTPSDYALLALRAPGALVARAHGVAGLDLERPGKPVPGVVGVFVVPAGPQTEAPPAPTAPALRAVADHLAATAAPAGVRVVVGAPEYQRVAVEAQVVLDPDAERADVLARAGDSLVTYLHPVRGGQDGGGWPFGGPLRHTALVRRLLEVPGVLAVPRLRLIVDGVAAPACADQPLRPNALPWPSRPLLIPVDSGVTA